MISSLISLRAWTTTAGRMSSVLTSAGGSTPMSTIRYRPATGTEPSRCQHSRARERRTRKTPAVQVHSAGEADRRHLVHPEVVPVRGQALGRGPAVDFGVPAEQRAVVHRRGVGLGSGLHPVPAGVQVLAVVTPLGRH